MKNQLYILTLFLIILLVFATFLNSCKKDEPEKCPDVDYTAIDQVISEAQQKHDTAVQGTLPGEYPAPAKEELQEAIDVTNTVRTKVCVTQQELNTTENVLTNAITEFETKRIPDCPEVDFTLIDQTIETAQSMHDNATEGTEPGEYIYGSKADLQQAINSAQTIRDSFCVSQQNLNSAIVSLENALEIFESKKIIDLSAQLVAQWLFNGNGDDATGNGHNGTASAGHVNWGAGVPEPATDRHGNANYCYKFVDGGNFVVPNSPDFIPAEMTISVWLNLSESWAHSFIISNDIWHSWKLQVQDANKPFFTAHFTKDDGTGEEAWVDKDSNVGILNLDTWYQVVLTYKSGEMTFYLNGEEVQAWDDFPSGTLIEPHTGVDLCIGQALPTAAYDLPDHQWEEWLGYFKGYMDDMRFYNVTLTDTQVKSLYDYEKVTTIE